MCAVCPRKTIISLWKAYTCSPPSICWVSMVLYFTNLLWSASLKLWLPNRTGLQKISSSVCKTKCSGMKYCCCLAVNFSPMHINKTKMLPAWKAARFKGLCFWKIPFSPSHLSGRNWGLKESGINNKAKKKVMYLSFQRILNLKQILLMDWGHIGFEPL